MEIMGIIIDTWKLELFEDTLESMGLVFTKHDGPTKGVTTLKIETDSIEKLRPFIYQMDVEAIKIMKGKIQNGEKVDVKHHDKEDIYNSEVLMTKLLMTLVRRNSGDSIYISEHEMDSIRETFPGDGAALEIFKKGCTYKLTVFNSNKVEEIFEKHSGTPNKSKTH